MENKKGRMAAGILFWALSAGIVVLMFCFSGQTGEESSSLSMLLTQWVLDHFSFIRAEAEILEHVLRKTAHFSIFAASGAFLYAALRFSFGKKRAVWLSLAASAVLAVANELHQLMNIERSCQVSDMLLDFSGAVAGILAAGALMWLAKKLFRRS